MHDAGLLVRKPAKHDRRVMIFQLTDKGRRELDESRRRHRQRDQHPDPDGRPDLTRHLMTVIPSTLVRDGAGHPAGATVPSNWVADQLASRFSASCEREPGSAV